MPDNNKKNSEKKAAEAVMRGADLYTTGGKAGQVLDKTEKIPGVKIVTDKGKEKLGKNLNRASGGNFGRAAEKLDDVGALDAVNGVLSRTSGNSSNNKPKSAPKPNKNNVGKNILNNNTNISKPNKSKKDKEKEVNNDKLKNQLEKNAVRGAVLSIGNINKLKQAEENNNNNDKSNTNNIGYQKEEEKKEQKKTDAKVKRKAAMTLFGTLPLQVKIGILVGVIGFIVILIIIALLASPVGRIADFLGVGSSGKTADITLSSDPNMQRMYERIINHHTDDEAKGKMYDAGLIVSVYHVLSNRTNFSPDDVNDAFIDELVSLMFPSDCGDSCSYSKDTFSTNLETVFFPKYLKEDECKNAAEEVFRYLNLYRELIEYEGDDEYDFASTYSGCGGINMNSTTLSREEFISKVKNSSYSSSGMQAMKQYAGKVYDISKQNNFNPELVVIRAHIESSPGGSTNNWWGIGCANKQGLKACKRYSTIDQGILAYITTLKGYGVNSLLEVYSVKHYAFIGAFWYSPGSSGDGGCYYYHHSSVPTYLSDERARIVGNYCSRPCSGNACLKTNEEDQLAYSKFQIESSVKARKGIFGIDSDDDCADGMNGGSGAELAAKVAKHAVEKYDSYQYDKDRRMQNGWVDCSSMVYRAYADLGFALGGNTTDTEYLWCEKNNKIISGDNLQPGDLIFYNTGRQYNSGHYKGIGHVEMYIGNGQKFGAHSHYSDHPADDVSVRPYYKGEGNLFCRPTK